MHSKERRKYVRLNRIFPVELQLVDRDNQPLSGLLQGFTHDISFEGLCVDINDFKKEYQQLLDSKPIRVLLFVNIPLNKKPIKAIGRIAWLEHTKIPYPRSYRIGIEYQSIDFAAQKRIIKFAKTNRNIPRLIAAVVLAFALLSGFLWFDNYSLLKDNRKLVEDLGVYSARSNTIKMSLDRIFAEKKIVERMLKNDTQKFKDLTSQVVELEKKQKAEAELKNSAAVESLTNQLKQLQNKLTGINGEKSRLEVKLSSFNVSETALKTELVSLEDKRGILEDRSLKLMYQWVVSSQSSKTGLITSYDNDAEFLDVGFTYDQALSAFNFIEFQEYEKADKIFSFFLKKAKRLDNGFANAYDVITGKVAEYVVHSGPAIYLGIAALVYEEKTKNTQYRILAQEIGNWLLSMQEDTAKGAIRGGPGQQWVSTEQNIAAYVFFERLFDYTKETKYKVASEQVFKWIKDIAYNKKLKRFNRGSGDLMIATDAIALAIMAFGPEKLRSMGISIDDLVKCIEDNCKARVPFENSQGKKINVTGFDFSCPSSVGRRGVIAVEWTAQMIIAFNETAHFYAKEKNWTKAKQYKRKASYYLGELEKMMLVRSVVGIGKHRSRAGLPYATETGIATGHGWRTPESGSISAAGTNFAIFAKREYNMFR